METAVVVGGGIGGIVSALVLRRRYDRVLLIERSPRLGGLLQTACIEDGLAFDLGTHFVATTGCAELDELLFDFVDERDWYEFDYLKAGNYFGGRLNEQSAFIDVRVLPRPLYLSGLEALLGTVPNQEEVFRDLSVQLVRTYGEVFAEHIFTPVLDKLFGVPPDQLAPDAHLLFGLKRLMLLNAAASRELKRSTSYDERIAFHDPSEGVNASRVFYPRQGGIGRWVEGLTDKLQQCGVEIMTGREVREIAHRHARIESVRLDDGSEVECDRLVWTVPPFLLARAASIDAPSCPPRLRHSSLVHFIFDRPFATDLHFLYVFDPERTSFRMTLYPNAAGREHDSTRGYHCTAEILSDGSESLEVLEERAREDFYAMGLVPSDAGCRTVGKTVLRAGFPVLTNDFVDGSRRQARYIAERFENVHLLGKASGASFFMNDVLREAYETLSNAA